MSLAKRIADAVENALLGKPTDDELPKTPPPNPVEQEDRS